MESLSRHLHRTKLPNAGKNAYDGVFSGHRRKSAGAPAVKVEEYREIFSTDCSIPVLDLPTLEESCDGLNMDIWRTKPDYGMIFGGFCDQDIAICYEELVTRDNARACAPSSASQSSQDLGELSNQPLDALKQFNMAYNKISQRSEDGLDKATHITQLPAVSGFTCFVNESASQPKETKCKKSFKTKNIHPSGNSSKGDFHEKQTSQSAVESGRLYSQDESLYGDRLLKTCEVDHKPYPSKVSSPPAASEPNKETENKKSYIANNIHPSVYSSKGDFHEKHTSQSAVESGSRYAQDESLSGDTILKTFEVDLESYPSKVSSPPAVSIIPNKETDNQKSCITNNIHPSVHSSKGDFHEKQTSQSAVESGSRYGQDESLPGDTIFKTFEVDLRPYPSKVSSPSAASEPNKETDNTNSYIKNNIHPSVHSSKGDLHEKLTSQHAVKSGSRYSQDEFVSSDRIFTTLEVDLKPYSSKVSSPPADSKPNKETENQKSYITNNIHPGVNFSKEDFHLKQTLQSAVESGSRYGQDESVSDDGIFKTFKVDLKPHPSEVVAPPAASQPNMETENQKSYFTNNFHPIVNSSKGRLHEKQTSQSAVESRSKCDQDESLSSDEIFKTFEVNLKLNKETENQKSCITNTMHSNSSKADFHETQISQSAVETRSGYDQDESLSGDGIFKTFEVDLKPHPSKVLSPPAASQPNKETENQKSNITNDIHPSLKSSKGDPHDKQTSQSAVESRSRYGQGESISDDKNFKKFQDDLSSHPSSSYAASATNSNNNKDFQKRSTATYGVSPPIFFDEELDVNSAAAVSAAALRKAIEKAQENIRIAKESVGRMKGIGGYSSKSFKDSLKVKAKVVNVKAGEEYKEEDHIHESTVIFPDFMDYEKPFGAKKVINELHAKIPELGKNSEIPIRSPVELGESKILFSSKIAVNKTESEAIENNTCEGSQKDAEKPDGFLILERSEKKLGDTESNNLTVHQKVEDEKEIPGKSDENGYEKKFCEGLFGFFETNKQENLEEEHDEKMGSAVSQVEDEREVKDEEKFNNVCEMGMIENAETYNFSIETNDLSQKEDYEIKETENDKAEETWEMLDKIQVETYEKSSIDFDDAEESKSVIGASQIVNDAEACKVDQNDSNAESSQEIDDSSRSESSGHKFQVEDAEAIDKETIENISLNEAEDSKDECDAKPDGLANYDLTDVDFVRDDYSIEINDMSQKKDYEIEEEKVHKAKETWKKMDKIQVPETSENSSDSNGAEESENVIGAFQIVDDTEHACKVDQNDNNAESSQEIDDSSRSESPGHKFQVEDAEAIDKETIENISLNEDSKDECDAKPDGLANYDLTDVDFVRDDYSIEINDMSQKKDYEIEEEKFHKAKETWKKMDKIQVPETSENSSDSNGAEESENVIGAFQIVDDTEHACKVDQNDNNAESSQEIDDVSSRSSSGHDFQVKDTEALEKVINENISSDETEDEYGCDSKSDDLATFGLADVDFVQNDVRSESSSDTILSTEIEVKEREETEETVEKEDNNLQQSHVKTPEIRIKIETGTQQEPDDASRESEPSKMVEKMHNEEEREQERIKLAVDRAIREARQRAFAEVRQRVLADTQEKVSKASSDKTCAQSKLKAERAAVERATAEARQRALEKAISQKKLSEPKIQINEINQTISAINHINVESALRSKAKLEKHNRIMERAAKALAEKEMRDLLALREQAERSRLAENLDADIKRWSGGKEGNLRALLSTLQYILGADSGWQPVSLTEIITTSAVKKAYRKATLCVHPDKLQQRGASIQQKYICEKVFDLLKAAWNRFNSEER